MSRTRLQRDNVFIGGVGGGCVRRLPGRGGFDAVGKAAAITYWLIFEISDRFLLSQYPRLHTVTWPWVYKARQSSTAMQYCDPINHYLDQVSEWFTQAENGSQWHEGS